MKLKRKKKSQKWFNQKKKIERWFFFKKKKEKGIQGVWPSGLTLKPID